jgi:predicted nuclease of predicted toxin-antitoxin system
MIIWLDAQLSPAMASWISREFSVEAVAVRDLGLRNASDSEIFLAARQANAVVMTKDADFVRLVENSGPPPQVILLACGNTSNSELKQILKRSLDRAMQWLQKGEPVVEIAGP